MDLNDVLKSRIDDTNEFLKQLKERLDAFPESDISTRARVLGEIEKIPGKLKKLIAAIKPETVQPAA